MSPSEQPMAFTTAGDAVELNWRMGAPIVGSNHIRKVMDLDTCDVFAVKSLALPSDEPTKQRARELAAEVERWSELQSQYVVQVEGLAHFGGELLLKLEFAAHGSMADFVEAFGPLTGNMFRDASLGILRALNYLHSQDHPLVHGNLKASNVLLAGEGMQVKLTDFWYTGTARRGLDAERDLPWAAPEVARSDGAAVSTRSDMWSLGCTMIELATGSRPWGARTPLPAVRAALAPPLAGGQAAQALPVPGDVPAAIRKVIGTCLEVDPERRPAAHELLLRKLVVGLSLPIPRRHVAGATDRGGRLRRPSRPAGRTPRSGRCADRHVPAPGAHWLPN